jgi:Sulfotransferase family
VASHPPILVVGPMTRCGTSLLQRLLNSTGKVVIYGENFALMQTLPDIIRGQQRGADGKRKVIEIARDMLVERVDFEASSLFPDYDEHLAAWASAFRRIVRLYEQDAAKLGFPRWGLKHQIRGQGSFALLPKLLPRARYVMIYRDLLDVARSAKARWPGDFKGPEDYRRFGRNWQDNVRTMRGLAGDNFLLLRYEEFVADPDPHLERLERFVGFDGIDRAVMTRKINDQPNYQPGEGQAGAADYRKPAALSADEVALLLAESAPLYRELGYAAAR